ncbi:MAG: hypothetical protein Q8L52_03855 [bacterium]|nr:hypothetical protein [bacterium]
MKKALMKNARSFFAAMLFLVTGLAFGQNVVEFEEGWNFKGNSWSQVMQVTETFGSFAEGGVQVPGVTAHVVSVWKWDAYSKQWQFYTPRIDPGQLGGYAKSRGLGVLGQIFPGEAYWVFSKSKTAIVQGGRPADYILYNWNFGMPSGWNMIASPISATPGDISAMMNTMPPSPSDQWASNSDVSSVVSLWAWDSDKGKWYFYSPNLDQSSPDYLRNYIYQKGYLDFESSGKTIEPGDGFWVNIQRTPQVPTVCADCGKGLSSSAASTGAATTKANPAGQ